MRRALHSWTLFAPTLVVAAWRGLDVCAAIVIVMAGVAVLGVVIGCDHVPGADAVSARGVMGARIRLDLHPRTAHDFDRERIPIHVSLVLRHTNS